MQNNQDKDDLRNYRAGPFSTLQWMAMLAILGLVLTWMGQHLL
jgi:hypothetical protein